MPIYEYKCENGHVFDAMQRISDDPLTSCVECGAPVRKVLQPVGISFKGSGFYSTDYSRKGPKEAPSSNGASDKASKSSDKSDSSSGSSEKKSDSSSSQKTAKK